MRDFYLTADHSIDSIGNMWIKLAAVVSTGAIAKVTITDDLVICFAIAALGAFGSMGLAKNTRHMLSEALAGICIGTGASFVALRSGMGSPIPELTALCVGVGGMVVPITIRHNIGKWIVELKERFFPPKKGPE